MDGGPPESPTGTEFEGTIKIAVRLAMSRMAVNLNLQTFNDSNRQIQY